MHMPSLMRIANARGGEDFIAVSAEARRQFWLDRARTAAIAKHTNAFKINEGVVIPLDRLGDYSDGIERINIELSLKNKIRLLEALEELFQGDLPVHQEVDKRPDAELLGGRPTTAVETVRAAWHDSLDIFGCQCPESTCRINSNYGKARNRSGLRKGTDAG